MEIRELSIPGAFEIVPRQSADERGCFLELFRSDALAAVVGRELHTAQVNCSVSRRGVLRGVHFADVPPGQAKYVTCITGVVLDVVVDVRVGSPTFGRFDTVLLDDVERKAVFVSEGLGHAFLSLRDGSAVTYLCSDVYRPDHERGVHPFDPDLAIPWPSDAPVVLSAKDAAAPSLAQARRDGVLPAWRGDGA